MSEDRNGVASTTSGVEGFQLIDAEGDEVGDLWPTRGDAVRHMGSVAMHGASLPLRVRGPDGRLTGDRLG